MGKRITIDTELLDQMVWEAELSVSFNRSLNVYTVTYGDVEATDGSTLSALQRAAALYHKKHSPGARR